jgi:hypothetical protein
MAEKRNLVEEALLQMKNLEEAVNENAKGILASTMKEEISELVKESLSEEDEVEEKMVSVDMEEGDYSEMSEEDMEEGKGHEMKEQEEAEIEVEDEEELELPDLDVEDEDEDEMDLDLSDEEGDEDMEMMSMLDLSDEDEVEDEEFVEPLDLTSISDEELLKVFKAMGEEDGIIIKQDDDEIHLKDENQDAEYIIQTEAEEDEEVIADEEMEGEYKEGYEMEEEDEMVYEIELEDEEEMSEEMEEPKEGWGSKEGEYKRRDGHKTGDVDGHYKDYEMEEGEMEETARSNASLRKYPNAKTANSNVKDYASDRLRPAVRENVELKKEVQQLREKNEEYRKALNIFKEKLNEVAVFNSNLAYATRLFTENTTTKQEKINILRRFDSVETLKESKALYQTLKEDFNSKNDSVVTESVKAKVTKSPSRGSASNLIESKTYENPQFMRMKDLMNKLG